MNRLPKLAFISLGSNIEPEKYLPRAVDHLRSIGIIRKTSRVYQNPAIAPEPQADYLNAAVLIETQLQPLEIRRRLREIEEQLDRVRSADKYAPRTIDLDLCLYNDLVYTSPELNLPDPDILNRSHLALTLSELRPDHILPGSDRSLSAVAEELMSDSQLAERLDVSLLIYADDQRANHDV
jgi:2-amino-4-hydroxy-6-hydroxymethyldihydropteridine diphosphokinase